MTPEHDTTSEQPAELETRRLAYALVDDQDVIVGLTVLHIPVGDFDAEQARLDAAHTDPAHRKIDASVNLPTLGDRIGTS